MEAVVLFDYSANESDELNLKVGDTITNVTKVCEGWCEGILNGKKGAFPDNFVKMIKKEEVKDVQKRPNAPVVAELRKQLSSVIGGPQPQLSAKKASNKMVKVTHQYIPQNDDEIALEIGQLIEVLKQEEPGWWEGNLNGKIGMFPSNFVEVIEEDTKNNTTDESAPIIKGRKVLGVGFGPNILGNSAINLRPTGIGNRVQNDAAKNQPVAQHMPKKPVVNVNAEEKPQIKAKVLYSYTAENDDELSIGIGDVITVIDQNYEDVGWWKGELNGKIGVFPDNFVEVIHQEKKKALIPPSNGISYVKPTNNQTSLDKIPKKEEKIISTALTSKIEFPKPIEKDTKIDLNGVQSTELLNNPIANRVHGPPARKPPSNFPVSAPKPEVKEIKVTAQNNPKVPPPPVFIKKEELQNKPLINKDTDDIPINSHAFVTRENYNELQKEIQNLREQLESLRRNHDRRYNELLAELEQEKKFRLSLQSEVNRLVGLLPDSNA